jgi:hypothetical protein
VFVGDRGMVTSHNLDDLRAHGHGYIVAPAGADCHHRAPA